MLIIDSHVLNRLKHSFYAVILVWDKKNLCLKAPTVDKAESTNFNQTFHKGQVLRNGRATKKIFNSSSKNSLW